MKTLVPTFFLIFSAISFLSNIVHGDEEISSCIQTPFPDVCKHYMSSNALSASDTMATVTSFREITLRLTMEEAIEAHRSVSSMELKQFDDKRAMSAWNDCLELYEDTVHQLNLSMSSVNVNDHLTSLSASIANQQTCQNGFLEFNIPSYMNSFSNSLSNFSKLLSNSLYVTNVALTSSSSILTNNKELQVRRRRRLLSGDFPDWLSVSDRRLLQGTPKADIVVAQDGTGNYKTISEAVAAAAKGSGRRIIHIKAGVYRENVEIKKKMKNIMIFGDGIDSTIITGGRNNHDGYTTFRSATFGVSGDGFIARDITFENTAGPQKEQAVALRSSSDHSVFYRCSFKGYQDTLYVHSQRQFYRDCRIYGTVDFIFGDAAAILQNCNIYVRKPMINQKNTITAQSRADPNENTGIVIHSSRIVAAGDLKPALQNHSIKTYLGRPWRKYSRTMVMKSYLGGLIDPSGWTPWDGNDFAAQRTLYYGEYMNIGAGADTGDRVKWEGYHVIASAVEASRFTVGNFLDEDSWISSSGVPFESGL